MLFWNRYTRDEIAEKLKIAPDRVSQILNGQKGYGGLKQKVQIRETKRSDSIRVGNKETDDERRTVHKTIYSLQDYDRFAGFDAVVKLKPASNEPPKQPKHELSKELSNETGTPNDGLSKISMKEKEREKREKEDIGGLADEVSRENEKNAKLLSSKAEHIEEQYLADAKPYLACLADSHDSDSIEADLLRAEKQTNAKEEHFRKVAEEHTGKLPLICAKCGEDLTGHGNIQKGGKFYCARPGCGYPPREASA